MISTNNLTAPAVAGPPPELPDLIPVRMLNEFTYCPRLGYLEWAQGEWADNIETMQGTFSHRNVDKPDRKKVESPESGDEKQASGGRKSPVASEEPTA